MPQLLRVAELINPWPVYLAGGGPSSFVWDFRHRFEGTDGATTFSNDEAGNRPVTGSGNAAIETTGALDGSSSLTLDGTGDAATVADASLWSPSGPFSGAAKIKMNALSGTVMSHYRNAAGIRNWWLVVTAAGSLDFRYNPSGSAASDTIIASATGLITTGVEYEVAVDRDSAGDIRLYIDGVMVQKVNDTSALFNAATSFHIGARTDSGGVLVNGFNGLIDDVRWSGSAAFCGSDAGYDVDGIPASFGQWDFSDAAQSGELLTVGIM